MATNRSSKFKRDETEYDGLSDADVVRAFLEHPHEVYVAVSVLEPIRRSEDLRDGTITPTVRDKRIELVLDPEDMKTVLEILDRRYQERTGRPAPTDLFTSADGEVIGGVMDGETDPTYRTDEYPVVTERSTEEEG